MKIKEWYMKRYASDDMGRTLLDDVTFEGLFDALNSYQDIYQYLYGDGMGGDSLMRERIFAKLACIMDVDYEVVYNQWLKT